MRAAPFALGERIGSGDVVAAIIPGGRTEIGKAPPITGGSENSDSW
ncbi:hypothetical protein CASFOL_039530 [Castilleja foliolosa]|uniref:Uncharacterized protein n=1 Tax=Castilleja foliolosa TaxID=1961234 RepID=A0ABD3BI72_9LAMI